MTKDHTHGTIVRVDSLPPMRLLHTKQLFVVLLLGGFLLVVASCDEGKGGSSETVKNPEMMGTGGMGKTTSTDDSGPPETVDFLSPKQTTDGGVRTQFDGSTSVLWDGGIPQIFPPDPDALPSQSCKVTEQSLASDPAEVLIILDRSTSLGEQEHQSGEAWWTLTTQAVNQGVKASESTVNWGLMLFPKGKDSKKCCIMPASDMEPQVEVEIAPKNASAIADALAHTEPSGEGTPTAKALLQGANYLRARTSGTQKYIILLTDGDPTCTVDNVCSSLENKDYTRTKDTIKHITSVFGIPVAVIGIAYPNSETDLQPNPKQLHLIDLAKLGGMPNQSKGQPAYYIATTKGELQDSFKSVYSKTVSCSFATGLKAPWKGDAAVDLLGKNVLRDSAHEEGWDFTVGGKSIVFFGRTCRSILQSTETVKPRLRLGCPNSSFE